MKSGSAFAGALLALLVAGCASQPYGGGWITLLDGTNLDHWNAVGDANWRVVDGVVQADKKGKDNGLLVSKNSYRDFEIRAEFWVSDDANSGIYMRCTDPKAITDRTCYEANIFERMSHSTRGRPA